MKNKNVKPIIFAILAAALYGINSPISKRLLAEISPTLMASLLYFGAGIGMLVIWLIRKPRPETEHLEKKQWPYILGMVVLDVIAPICLMIGLQKTTAANASLLNNFEIVATALISMIFFKEILSKRLWAAIAVISAASFLLSFEDLSSLKFSLGSLFVLLAAVSWGLENNCTRVLSKKDPFEIVIIKGLASGTGALIVALIAGIGSVKISYLFGALSLGFVAYGLSIFFYVRAQRDLGAAKTSAFYAFAPFIGAGLSFLIFRNSPTIVYLIALVLMIIGAYLTATDYRHRHLADIVFKHNKNNKE